MNGQWFTVGTYYRSGTSRSRDYASYDAGVRFAKSQARRRDVSHVEISQGNRIVWDSLEGVGARSFQLSDYLRKDRQ